MMKEKQWSGLRNFCAATSGFPAGICRVGGGLEDYQGTVVRLEEGLSGLEYRLESVNAMLAAIRASAGTAWHC